jgi:ubiquinone/menaquinone biosynthesis C-methylase UbiE
VSTAPPIEPALDPKRANMLYHDAAARRYDAKWSIAFDDRCTRYVGSRARRMLPRARYDRVLEIGCGTGFFVLNLWRAGYTASPEGCDISPGMLAVCAESARRIGCDIRLRTADVECLPYPDESFDLVVGHAVLHHLPEPAAAIRHAHRVLRPGGALLVAGEPTLFGDRLAKRIGRLTHRGYHAVGRIVPWLGPEPARARADLSDDERILRDLEWTVDLHTFEPAEVEGLAREAGFTAVRTETEELSSSAVGWAVRTIESQAPPGLLGSRWATIAYRTYLALYALDQRLLYRILPKRLFYNLLLYGEKRG